MTALVRSAAGLPVLLALWAAAAALLFAPGLAALAEAWATPEYSHGPLIPLISAWLLARGLQAAPAPGPAGAGGAGPGLAALAVALALAALAHAVGIGDLAAYGLIAAAFAALLLTVGWRSGLPHWAAIAHLAFMLPLPQVLWWKLSLALQGVSAELGVALMRLAGVPVWLDGHVIDLGVWRLEVAEACSGLRYLFPILSFAVIVAVLFRGPAWAKGVLVAAAVPIAVALNAGRVGAIGVLVDRRGLSVAEGALHALQGWVVFGGCLTLLLGLAAALRAVARTDGPLLDLGGVDLRRAWAALGAAPVRRGAVTGAAATAAAALLLAFAPRPEPVVPARAPFAAFPDRLSGWSVRATALDPEVEAVLGATDYLDAALVAPGEAAPVNLFAAWYADQTGGEGLHSPEVCLPAGGWEIAALARVPVATTGPYGTFEANRAVIARGSERRLVLYWFEQRGRRMTSDHGAKLALLRDGVLSGRTDGALIRAMTPIAPGEAEAQAEARLRRALDAALPGMPAYVPF